MVAQSPGRHCQLELDVSFKGLGGTTFTSQPLLREGICTETERQVAYSAWSKLRMHAQRPKLAAVIAWRRRFQTRLGPKDPENRILA
jgi:hypothetical protein